MAEQVIKHDQIFEDKVIQPTIDQFNEFNKILGLTEEGLKKVAAVIGKKISIADPKTISDLETFTADLERLKKVQGEITATEKLHIQVQELQRKKTKEIRDEIKGQVSAYQALQNEFAKAAQKAKDLAAAQGINSKAAKESAQIANELNNKLKAIDATFGVHNREVGNYAEGISKAFQGTGLLGEGIEKVNSVLEKGKAVVEFFSSSIEKMNEFFKSSKVATEAATVAEEVNTAAKETNTLATEANAVATEEVKVVEEASTIAEEVNTTATEVNTVAQKENMLAKLGWIGVAVAALIVVGKSIIQTATATQAEKDLMDARTEAAEAAAKQLLNLKVNKEQLIHFIIEEVLAEKALEDARIRAIVPIQELKTAAAEAREEAMKDNKTTAERIKFLTLFIDKTKEAAGIELELAAEERKIKQDALNFEKQNPTGTEREKTKALEEASAKELAIRQDLANGLRRTEKMRTSIIEKDLADRKKMLQDSQREEIEIINTNANTRTETIKKQLSKDISLNKIDTQQRIDNLIDQQNKLGAIDASGIDHTAEFQREVDDLRKVGLAKRKELELKAQTEIWKISTDAQTEAFNAQKSAEKEFEKWELEAITGKHGAVEQIISQQNLETKIALGTESPAELEAWVSQKQAIHKKQIDDEQAFVDYELKAITGLYGEVEQKIAEQELSTKVALGLPLTDAELAYLAGQKKKQTEDDKKRIDEEFKTVEEITKGIAEGLKKRSELQQQADQKDIDQHQRMLDIQTRLASEGKDNVLAETLAQTAKAEEKKLQDAKKAAKQQEALALIETFTKTLQAALKADKPFLQAFGEALASEGLVSAAFSKLFAGFYEGTTDTGTTDSPLDAKGGRVAVLHDNERVVPKRLNDQLDGISNDELVRRAVSPDLNSTFFPKIMEAPAHSYVDYQVLEMTKEIKALRNDMASRPVQSNRLERLGEWTEQIQEKNVSTIIHHKKSTSRPSLRLNG